MCICDASWVKQWPRREVSWPQSPLTDSYRPLYHAPDVTPALGGERSWDHRTVVESELARELEAGQALPI